MQCHSVICFFLTTFLFHLCLDPFVISAPNKLHYNDCFKHKAGNFERQLNSSQDQP
jgi:hypothetical protein